MWKKSKKYFIRINEQFEKDLEAFKSTGLERKSILDIEINKEIEKKLKETETKKAKKHSIHLYVLRCLNANICPICGEEIEEIQYPKSPGCWSLLEKCTKCDWQTTLSDLLTLSED